MTTSGGTPRSASLLHVAVPRWEACTQPAVAAVLDAFAQRGRSKLLLTELAVQGGGLGNEFNGLLNSFLVALLTNRSLLVDVRGSNVAEHLHPPEILGGWALGREAFQAARRLKMEQLIELCGVDGVRSDHLLCASRRLHLVAQRTSPTSDWLRNKTNEYLAAHGWSSVSFETMLGCASRRLLQPGKDVRREMPSLDVAETTSAVGVHLRGSDRHMANAAQLATRGAEAAKVPVPLAEGRRLAFNFVDRQFQEYRHCLEDYPLIAVCLAERLPAGHAVFVASDAATSIQALDATWQARTTAPKLLHTIGTAIHTAYGTGGGINATAGYVKALADFFLLTRAAIFLPNCGLRASCNEHEATRSMRDRGVCLRGHASTFAFHVRNFRVELDMPGVDLFDLQSVCNLADQTGLVHRH